jgi:predicted ATPase/DNA-binding SARP family transcriptional activator
MAESPELPVHLTHFVGRDRELDELAHLLASARFVTLTGAGGSGKSRLAREAAQRVAPQVGRVVWADFAPLGDAGLVAQQVAAALRAPERADGSAIRAIVATIGEDPLLLVLDNCEHVVVAAAELAEALLRACPRLVILATSREVLGIASEVAWLVPPLAVAEALDLFVERARSTLPSFALSDNNRGWVAEICRRLDRIPLAIELAAARVRVLPPEQIARRLDDAFQLLTTGSRTSLPRHRTLRATMEWSHGLLNPLEQVLLRRLSVFAGSFTLEAAEVICAGAPLEVEEILDGVAALVDKSLVTMEPGDGVGRYRLLETVRQYATERANEAGERAAFEERHARWFLAMVEQAEPSLVGGSSAPDVLARLTAELDNLRSAAGWAVADPAQAEVGLRFAASLYWLWYAIGAYGEARHLTDRALVAGANGPPPLRGRALVSSALIALGQGEYRRSIEAFEVALPLLEGDDAAAGTGSALGAARLLDGDIDGAIYTLDEALALSAEQPEHHPSGILARFWRSWAAYAQGDLEMAHALIDTNERVGREHGLLTTRGHSLATLARIQLAGGHVERARELAAQALEIEVAIADRWGIAFALDVAAMLAARAGHAEDAARMLGGTAAHRARVALALPGLAPAEREQLIERLRGALDKRYEPLYDEGAKLSTAEIVELARREMAAPPGQPDAAALLAAVPTPTPPPSPAPAKTGPRLRVQALGPLHVSVDGRAVDASAWGSARPRELLVYLLMYPDGRTKEQVGLAFWPDASTAQLRNNFHVTLHRLRKALGGSDWVSLEHDRYRIDPELFELDAELFDQETTAARRALKRKVEGAAAQLAAALARYRGDFLDGESFGDWHLEHRDALQRLYVDASMELGAYQTRAEEPAEAAETYRRVLARDELHEEALRALMRALGEAGERSQALRAYQRFAEKLAKELEAEPEEETVELMEELQAGN